jgi:glycosyltransferase involved in cell wall biosynthesis
VAVVPFHDELAELPALLENLAPQVDGIIALDDGSTDGGARIMRDHPAVLEVLRVGSRTPHDWDEVRNRRLLVDAAARHGARWIVAVDADERLERGFRLRAEALIERAGPDAPGAYWVTIRELWDGPAQYRVDGVWGRKRSARLFRCRPDHDFGSLVYHGHWAPENSRGPDGDFAAADLVIYHRAMISPADREARKERHKRLDPDRRWQAMGYDYMTDETGLHLEPLPPGREYQPEAG